MHNKNVINEELHHKLSHNVKPLSFITEIPAKKGV